MHDPEKRNPESDKIEEGDIHAEDIERRAFLRIGVFAATGLAGLTMGCGGDDNNQDTTDSGDPVDNDPTDGVDTDVGDSSDAFDFDPNDPADTD